MKPLLPPGAVMAAVLASAPPTDWAARYPEEAARMSNAATVRRAEFHAGRECARECLRQLGLPEASIPADEEGLPQWPGGVTGSITHSRGLCLAVMSAGNRYASLGIDLERTGRMSAAAAERILHEKELAFAGDDRDRATLLFSLKEAFFKCQFPVFRVRPGFRDVAFEVDEAGSSASVIWLARGLTRELRDASGRMTFRCVRADGRVVGLTWLRAI